MTGNQEFQDAFCQTPGSVTAMVDMYKGCTSRSVLLALTRALCSVVRDNHDAQNMFVEAGVCDFVAALLTVKVFRQPFSILPFFTPTQTPDFRTLSLCLCLSVSLSFVLYSFTCTEVSGVENIGQCGRLSQLSWFLGAL